MNVPVRVLLLEVPKLLRDILEHAIRQDEGYELIVEPRSVMQMSDGHVVLPDVVVLGLTAGADVTLVPALFARWPGAQVLTILQTGADAVVYELRPRRQVLGEISPAEILVRLRDAVQRQRELASESFNS